MSTLPDLIESFGNEKVEVSKALLIRTYAALATGSFVPSMFAEVRDVMITLDSHLGAVDEGKSANRDSGNGSNSGSSL